MEVQGNETVTETETVVVTQCSTDSTTQEQLDQNTILGENTSSISQLNQSDNPDSTEQANENTIIQDGSTSSDCE